MQTSVVTRKGQCTIPKAIRQRLGIKEGDRVSFVERDEGVVIQVEKQDISALFGIIKVRKGVSLKEIETTIQLRGAESDRS